MGDKIIEIKPLPNNEFEIVWEWRAVDHLVQDINPNLPNYGVIEDFPERLNFNFLVPGSGANFDNDWMHSNAIDYNPELDQIILNSRNFNEFFIIDHSTTLEEASGSTGGRYNKGGDLLYRWGNPAAYNSGTLDDQRLFSQHDAHWIDTGLKDEGKIFVYNNGINRPGGFATSVDIIVPPILADGSYEKIPGQAFAPESAEWTYGLEPGHENINSSRISGVGRMPNGNTMITVGGAGKIVELDEDLNVAWEYILPVAGNAAVEQGETTNSNTVFRSYKYPLDYQPFLDNNITVGDPIEINPNNQFCISLPTEETAELTQAIELVNTLIAGQLIVKSLGYNSISIVDINGRVYNTFDLYDGIQTLELSKIPNGIYFIQSMNSNKPILQPLRFVKMN